MISGEKIGLYSPTEGACFFKFYNKLDTYPLGQDTLTFNCQNMTVATREMAEWKTFGHQS